MFTDAIRNALRTANRRNLESISAPELANIAVESLVRRKVLSQGEAEACKPDLVEVARYELRRRYG